MAQFTANRSSAGAYFGSCNERQEGKDIGYAVKSGLYSMGALFSVALCIGCIMCFYWTVWNACECMAAVYTAGLIDVSNFWTHMEQNGPEYIIVCVILFVQYSTGYGWKVHAMLTFLACMFLPVSVCPVYLQLVTLMFLYKIRRWCKSSTIMRSILIFVFIFTIISPYVMYMNPDTADAAFKQPDIGGSTGVAPRATEDGVAILPVRALGPRRILLDTIQFNSITTRVVASDLLSLFGADKSVTLKLMADPFVAFYSHTLPLSVLRLDPATWEDSLKQAFSVKHLQPSNENDRMQGATFMDVVRNFAKWVNPESVLPRLDTPKPPITLTVNNENLGLNGNSNQTEDKPIN